MSLHVCAGDDDVFGSYRAEGEVVMEEEEEGGLFGKGSGLFASSGPRGGLFEEEEDGEGEGKEGGQSRDRTSRAGG